MTEFLEMGGYGGYIWPAYGVSALVIGGLIVMTMARFRRSQKRLEELEKSTSIKS